MIFPESFPIFYSLGLVAMISTIIFFWRSQLLKKRIFENLNALPSILVLGSIKSGKTTFLLSLTNSYPKSSLLEGMNISNFKIGEKEVQLIEIPFSKKIEDLKSIEKMNVLGGFYLFDVSKDALPIEEQIENFKLVKKFLKKPLIPIANKIDIADEEKMEKLKSLEEKVHMISLLEASRKKELEDVMTLVKRISSELVKEKSTLT